MLVLAMQFSRNSHGGLRPPWTPRKDGHMGRCLTWGPRRALRGRRARDERAATWRWPGTEVGPATMRWPGRTPSEQKRGNARGLRPRVPPDGGTVECGSTR